MRNAAPVSSSRPNTNHRNTGMRAMRIPDTTFGIVSTSDSLPYPERDAGQLDPFVVDDEHVSPGLGQAYVAECTHEGHDRIRAGRKRRRGPHPEVAHRLDAHVGAVLVLEPDPQREVAVAVPRSDLGHEDDCQAPVDDGEGSGGDRVERTTEDVELSAGHLGGVGEHGRGEPHASSSKAWVRPSGSLARIQRVPQWVSVRAVVTVTPTPGSKRSASSRSKKTVNSGVLSVTSASTTAASPDWNLPARCPSLPQRSTNVKPRPSQNDTDSSHCRVSA